MNCMGRRGAGKRLNDSQRLEIITKLQQPNAPSKRAIAREYDIGESAVRMLWDQRESIIERTQDIPESSRATVFRMTRAQFPELEDCLLSWIDTMHRLNLELPPSLVIAKAREIAKTLNIPEKDFKASWGWLANFRARNGLRSILVGGEGAEVDKESPDLLSGLNEESEEEESKSDEAVNRDDPQPFGSIDDVFADILSLGPKIRHSDFAKQSMGLHQNICSAYENLLSVAMNIKRQRTRQMAMRS